MNETKIEAENIICEELRAKVAERLQGMGIQDLMDMADYAERIRTLHRNAGRTEMSDAARRDYSLKVMLFNLRAEQDGYCDCYPIEFEKENGISIRSATGIRWDGFCQGFDAACHLFEHALL